VSNDRGTQPSELTNRARRLGEYVQIAVLGSALFVTLVLLIAHAQVREAGPDTEYANLNSVLAHRDFADLVHVGDGFARETYCDALGDRLETMLERAAPRPE